MVVMETGMLKQLEKKTPIMNKSLIGIFTLLLIFGYQQQCQAWKNVNERLNGLVVHIASMREGHENSWIMRSDYHDGEWGYYTRFEMYSEDQVLSVEKNKFLASDCEDGYVCLESVEYQASEHGMPFRNRYLAATYPHDSDKKMVLLRENFYPQTDDSLHWKIECENDDLKHCRIISKRWSDLGMCNAWRDKVPGGPDTFYDLLLPIGDTASFWKIYAPTPTDTKALIYSNENQGSSEQSYKKEFTVGMATSDTHTETITSSTTLEVEKSFKKFSTSAGVSSTIDASWSDSSTDVFAAKVTVTQTWVTAPQTKLEVYQLHGSYGGVFSVFSENYVLEETDLSSGTKKVTRSRLKKPDGPAKVEL